MQGENKTKWFKEEIQFIAWIMAVTIAVVVPLITSQKNIEQSMKEIEEIKIARVVAWDRQYVYNDKFLAQVSEISECLAVMKERLQIK